MKVAILSVDYLPLMYCDVKRAICLLYQGKAEMVKATDLFMRSVSTSVPIPKIIRLLNKTLKIFNPKIVFTRRNVFIRDKWTCQYCGEHGIKLTIDHVHPKSKGGEHSWENVVAACKPCNDAKRDKLPQVFGMPRKSPHKPSRLIHIDWDEIFPP